MLSSLEMSSNLSPLRLTQQAFSGVSYVPGVVLDIWAKQIHSYFLFLVAQMVKNLPAVQETQIPSLGQKIPWSRKWQPTPVFLPDGLQAMGSQRARHNWATNTHTHTHTHTHTKKEVCLKEIWVVYRLWLQNYRFYGSFGDSAQISPKFLINQWHVLSSLVISQRRWIKVKVSQWNQAAIVHLHIQKPMNLGR